MRLALLTTNLAIATILFDQTAVTTILPEISDSLGVPTAQSVLLVNAYQVTMACGLVPLAALGQRIGFRKVYLAGLVVQILATLMAVTVEGFEALLIARLLQGFAGSMVVSVNLPLIRAIVPPERFGMALGLNGTVIAASAAAGPLFAGLIVSQLPWQWVFLLTLPLSMFGLAVGLRNLPPNTLSQRPFDLLSALLGALGFGGLILAFALAGQGQPPVLTLPLAIAALIALAGLIRHERSSPEPSFALDLVRGSRVFAWAILNTFAAFIGQMLLMVSTPVLLKEVMIFPPLEAGLLLAVWPCAMAISGPLSGTAADRVNPQLIVAGGLLMTTFGLAGLAMMPMNVTMIDVAWRIALCGFGFGMYQIPNNRTLMNEAPPLRSSGAASMLGVSRMLGQAVGATMAAWSIVSGHIMAGLWLGAVITALAVVPALLNARRLAARRA